MDLAVAVLLGASFGVLTARVKVPRIEWIPFIACMVLFIAAVVVYLQIVPAAQLAGVVMALSDGVAFALYAGVLWKREELEPGISYWGWVRREMVGGGYTRRLYATVHNERLRGSAETQLPS